MKLIEKVFGRKTTSNLRMRFSKTEDAWIVYREESIVYIGNREACLNFMDNQLLMERNAI